MPELSGSANAIYPWLRALFWLAVVIGLGWLLFRHRVVIWTALQNAWAAIRGFLKSYLAPCARLVGPRVPASLAWRRFRRSRIRFSRVETGFGRRKNLLFIVMMRCKAGCWSRKRKRDRRKPRANCARQAGVELPEAAPAFEQLVFLYGHVAYGAMVPTSYDPENLRRLWGVWLAAETANGTHYGGGISADSRMDDGNFPPMPLTFTAWLPRLFQFQKQRHITSILLNYVLSHDGQHGFIGSHDSVGSATRRPVGQHGFGIHKA